MSQPTQVTIQQAYDEACQALGEATVQQRLMAKAAAAQIDALKAELAVATADASRPA